MYFEYFGFHYNMSLFPGMGSATTHRSGMQGFGYSPGKQATGK